jgi:16S rRNA C967 or C1407 C5-methylase (RsmB/RsmF family)
MINWWNPWLTVGVMARKAKVSFDSWYGEHYGERWPLLKEALIKDPVAIELQEGLLKPYYLDRASCLAAKSLDAAPGETILDMCAAPGGKSLILAVALGGKGALVANDRSSARRERLRRVLAEYLPPITLSAVRVTSHDATRWGLYEQDLYDRVLLDAPCSSERHVLRSESHLSRWSPARSRHLANQAYAMLAAAYTAVKPGGVILYSTCALSPLENDGVVGKLLAKRDATILPVGVRGERTEYGIQITPDRDNGSGPMYLSKITK